MNASKSMETSMYSLFRRAINYYVLKWYNKLDLTIDA